MINKAQIFNYVATQYGTQPDYPWRKYPDYAVLRHAHHQKWYGLVMSIPKIKLGLGNQNMIDIINIKCPPELIWPLRQNAGFLPAYHMNKQHWITAMLDGSIPAHEIYALIDQSFTLTH